MREHMGLYRGKRLDNGAWVEGFYLEFNMPFKHNNESCIQTLKQDGHLDFMHIVDPDTVGECTAMRDKNGKLIFEGDVCKACLNPEICTATVKYRDNIASFVMECNETEILLFVDMMVAKNSVGDAVWVEYIGNVHDNPELLEGGANHAAD